MLLNTVVDALVNGGWYFIEGMPPISLTDFSSFLIDISNFMAI